MSKLTDSQLGKLLFDMATPLKILPEACYVKPVKKSSKGIIQSVPELFIILNKLGFTRDNDPYACGSCGHRFKGSVVYTLRVDRQVYTVTVERHVSGD